MSSRSLFAIAPMVLTTESWGWKETNLWERAAGDIIMKLTLWPSATMSEYLNTIRRETMSIRHNYVRIDIISES